MTNPYASSLVPVEDTSTGSSANTSTAPFFAVSLTKLLVMSICTLGLYEIYWFYQNWKRISIRQREKILPAARALFAVLFCYQCFARIRDYDAQSGGRGTLAAGPLAAGWILTTIMWKLPDPYWWISMAAILFMLPVQARVNRINSFEAPTHAPNSRFSVWNWLGIILGGLVVVFAILGTIIPKK